MSDEYLWDRSGEPDPEVERLEQLMGTLAFSPARMPVLGARLVEEPRSRLGWRYVLGAALLTAAATLLLIGGWERLDGSRQQIELELVDVAPVTAPAGPASDEPRALTPAEPQPGDPQRVGPVPPRVEPLAPSSPERGPTMVLGRRPTAEAAREALVRVRDQAKACGPLHRAVPGTTVTVKLSIEAGTGRVAEATAQRDHQGTALGRCVAEALAEARFPPSGEKWGLTYGVTMK